ncbi:MAG: cyclohexanecarboxylate-CoA ligase [Actinobacteria bacterium]|nr:MAG: cyclohexanecarboxylate-CoA ligase [Actinomycetota bacterium]
MRLRPTFTPARARHYRRPGGPWDLPPLDAVLAPRSVAPVRLVDGSVRLTGPELEARVAALAGGLRARGVRRADVVAWQLPNWHESVLLYRACWRLGAVAAPLHHSWGTNEVARILDLLEPRLVLGGTGMPARDAPEAVPVRGGDGAFPSLLGTGRPVSDGGGRPTDLAVVLFTSGSTGEPKAVLHTQRSLAYKARLMAGVHGLGSDDAVLMPAPLAHVSGLLNAVLVPGAAGMSTVLMERWDPEAALTAIEAERVSYMVGPPTFFLGLMSAATFSRHRVASLRLVSSGGAGVSPAFVARATAELGCQVKRSYGSTEAPTMTTTTASDPPRQAQETDGRPVGEVELRISDPNSGRALPPGAEGELWVRGPELFAGYADAAQTREATWRGWFRTGDLARLDGERSLTIVGRIKDVIIRGGENIAAAEVEAVLEAHPSVRQAVAVGYPDERLGERVAVFVVSDDPFDLETCRAWFAERGVARFKTPELVIPVSAVPSTAAGKPDRAALKERLPA